MTESEPNVSSLKLDELGEFIEPLYEESRRGTPFSPQSASPTYNNQATRFYPSRITKHIWLGGNEYFPSDSELDPSKWSHGFLKRNNIELIVSIVQDLPEFVNDIKDTPCHLHIPIVDHPSVNILKHIHFVNEFIQRAVDENKNVYIHCAAGISRSASFVIAYLMQRDKKKFDQVFSRISKQRSVVDPNWRFILCLMTYEKWLESDQTQSLIDFSAESS